MSKFKDWYKSKNINDLMLLCSCARYDALIEAFEAGQKAGMDWISVSDRLPKDCRPVLVKAFDTQGFKIETIGRYCRRFEVEAPDDLDIEYCDHNIVDDRFYLLKGWHKPDNLANIDFINDITVTHWREFSK